MRQLEDARSHRRSPTGARPRACWRRREPRAGSARSPPSRGRVPRTRGCRPAQTSRCSPSEQAPVLELEHAVLALAARRGRADAAQHLDALAAQRLSQRLAEGRGLAREHPVVALDQHDLSAEAAHDLGQLEAGRAAAEHDQPPRHRLHPGRLARRPQALELAQALHGRDERIGAGREHDVPRLVDRPCRPRRRRARRAGPRRGSARCRVPRASARRSHRGIWRPCSRARRAPPRRRPRPAPRRPALPRQPRRAAGASSTVCTPSRSTRLPRGRARPPRRAGRLRRALRRSAPRAPRRRARSRRSSRSLPASVDHVELHDEARLGRSRPCVPWSMPWLGPRAAQAASVSGAASPCRRCGLAARRVRAARPALPLPGSA